MSVEVELPDRCECGFENLKIWGTRTRAQLNVEVRCMKCGKVLWRVEN